MVRSLAAAALLTVAASSLAQGSPRRADAPPPGAGAPPAAPPGSAPAASAPAATPAPKGPRELEDAKRLGRQGLVKIAPKLGGSRAEKLAKDKGGAVVDRAVDLAAEATGLLPKR